MAVSEPKRLCEVEVIRRVRSEMLNRKATAFCAVVFLRQMEGARIQHVFQRLVVGVGGNRRIDGHPHAGVGAVGDHRGDVGGVEAVFLVENRVGIAVKFAPAGRGPVESGALRRAFAAAEVVERGLVGGDHAAPRPAFDAHVADGHAPLHREGADRVAGEFDEIARAARSGQPGDDVEDDVLGFDARPKRPVHGDAHAPRLGLDDALAGEDHFDLRRPHAERHGAQRPVRRGVAVAADDGHARLGEAQFGTDDVHDALPGVAHAEMLDAEPGAVGRQRFDLPPRFRLGDRQVLVDGGDVVVGRRRDSTS